MEPTREQILEVTKALLIDAEDQAWGGWNIYGDDDATWRRRLANQLPDWSELINRGRATLEAAGVEVPTPLQIREENERQREEARRRQTEERKARLDAKRCKSCGHARGHKASCPNRK